MTHPTPDAIRSEIATILGLPPDSLTDSIGVGSIPEWDSLAQLAIITALEEEFGIRIPEEQMMLLSDIECITACVQSLLRSDEKSLHPVPTESVGGFSDVREVESIVGALVRQAESCPAKSAIIFERSSLTYRQLVDGLQCAAVALRERGLCEGDVLALGVEKTPEFFFLYFGAHLLGVTVVLVDISLRKDAVHDILEQAKPKMLLGALPNAASLPVCGPAVGSVGSPLSLPQGDTVADIMFTTGTTGLPKGVMLTHRNLLSTALRINDFVGTHHQDVEVVALPISRSFGLGRVRCLLVAGATAVMASGFGDSHRLLHMVQSYRATGFAMVPAAWAYLHRVSGEALARYAPQLRYIELGSSAMPVQDKELLMRLFPHTRLCMHYGLTEASRSTFIEFHSDTEHLCTAGRPTPGVELSICGEGGAPLPPMTEGEICIRGSHVMAGYWRSHDPDAFYGDYLRTGDAGYITHEGYLVLNGRIKELINVGGKKVSPEEVENVLKTIPGIADAACVAAPDPQGILGEVVRAVLVADASVTEPSAESIVRQAAVHLATHQVPAIIEWRDSLPRTDSGKLQRLLLS